MSRGYNFGAGPAMLPDDILLEIQSECLEWQHLGMSVMEIGHRTLPFKNLLEDAENSLRQLLNIPSNYHVLFLGLPARMQFSMIPMNFLHPHQSAGYLVSGVWSELAFQEASRLNHAYCLGSSESDGFTEAPNIDFDRLRTDTSYVYFTSNETINGVRFANLPRVNNIPLIADMTSSLLSEPINIEDYALVFAGAQKNIANAGLCLLIIRDDFLETSQKTSLPSMLDYKVHCAAKSLYATPPTFNCYVALKMFKWIEKQGGVDTLYKINRQKAEKLYNYIDASSFYHCGVKPGSRSFVNICFNISNQLTEEKFIHEAEKNGLLALRGHRSVGGLRASIYNAMPLEGVEKLLAFMDYFASQEGYCS